MKNQCDTCVYYVCDEKSDEYFCDMNMDEDDYYRFMKDTQADCPFWRNGDEYAVVKHQL